MTANTTVRGNFASLGAAQRALRVALRVRAPFMDGLGPLEEETGVDDGLWDGL